MSPCDHCQTSLSLPCLQGRALALLLQALHRSVKLKRALLIIQVIGEAGFSKWNGEGLTCHSSCMAHRILHSMKTKRRC